MSANNDNNKLKKIDSGTELTYYIDKLNVYRTIIIQGGDCAGDQIYEFWRISQDNQVNGSKNTPHTRGAAKELAMIVIKADRKSFKVQYYPLDKKLIQVTKALPIDELQIAVEELKQAGF